ncbi:hypothetical protein A5742_04755 [Mycolicibacterium fortuitum]|uniref:PASTA domain-containing protein n=1 Tax=Mycolicibacterium fortuitum TaxID=1766 RepID=A0ABD6QI17_MYCFO|nr:hypothetical protein A5742_04755 [Mycolicibacterium fortuitum]
MSIRRCRSIHKSSRPLPLGGSLAAGAVLLGVLFGPAAVAGAAPSGPSSVDQVVRQLKTQGYAVIVNRFGTGRSDDCAVTAVRHGQTYSRTDHGVPGGDFSTTVTGKTVYVDVKC